MSNQTRLLVVSLPLLATVVFFARGCGRYNEVNAITYEHAKALYSVCNRQDTERLQVCENMIQAASESEAISGTEESYLTNIIKIARNGQWKAAEAMARQLMVDQVE